MADEFTTSTTLSNDYPNVYITRKTYELAEKNLRLGRWARREQLPQRMGKTMRIVRYKRLPLPFQPLQEGVPPDAVALATENVDIPLEQWGIVALLTDVAQIVTTHPALQIAIERTALAMSETLEREIAEVLMSGTNVFYAGGVAGRANLDGTKKLSTGDVIAATVHLHNRGAMEFEPGLYGGVMPPQVEGDLLGSDNTLQAASNFANTRRLDYGEIGIWQGVRWVRGNFLPIFKGVAAPDTNAATAEKAQVTASDTGGTLTSGNYQFVVVARDKETDYERKISVQSANINSGTGNNDSFSVTMPSSTNYVYDLYVTQAGGTTPFLVASRQAASAAVSVTTNPSASNPTPPASPAASKEVFVSFIFGKDAFVRVELDGMSMQSYITPPGPSFSNPLAQARKVGSKIMWKCAILDPEFFIRLESNSTYAAGLAA